MIQVHELHFVELFSLEAVLDSPVITIENKEGVKYLKGEGCWKHIAKEDFFPKECKSDFFDAIDKFVDVQQTLFLPLLLADELLIKVDEPLVENVFISFTINKKGQTFSWVLKEDNYLPVFRLVRSLLSSNIKG